MLSGSAARRSAVESTCRLEPWAPPARTLQPTIELSLLHVCRLQLGHRLLRLAELGAVQVHGGLGGGLLAHQRVRGLSEALSVGGGCHSGPREHFGAQRRGAGRHVAVQGALTGGKMGGKEVRGMVGGQRAELHLPLPGAACWAARDFDRLDSRNLSVNGRWDCRYEFVVQTGAWDSGHSPVQLRGLPADTLLRTTHMLLRGRRAAPVRWCILRLHERLQPLLPEELGLAARGPAWYQGVMLLSNWCMCAMQC